MQPIFSTTAYLVAVLWLNSDTPLTVAAGMATPSLTFFYTPSSAPLLIMLVLTLLIVIVGVIKIRRQHGGPLRPFG